MSRVLVALLVATGSVLAGATLGTGCASSDPPRPATPEERAAIERTTVELMCLACSRDPKCSAKPDASVFCKELLKSP